MVNFGKDTEDWTQPSKMDEESVSVIHVDDHEQDPNCREEYSPDYPPGVHAGGRIRNGRRSKYHAPKSESRRKTKLAKASKKRNRK